MRYLKILLLFLIPFSIFSQKENEHLTLLKTIKGDITPKSIVYTPKNYFFAQNMMYKHTITVYDSAGTLVKTISDQIRLSKFGDSTKLGIHKGAPVEAAYTYDSNYIWVSNYHMHGVGYDNPGTDNCRMDTTYDKSFLYKISLDSLKVVGIAETGCIPKFLATTPDNKYVLVSNWCSGDVSIIDNSTHQEVKRVKIGRYPRGIAIDKESKYAYVAAMGESKIVVINLKNFSTEVWDNIGRGPRHLCIDNERGFLYATLNHESLVTKIDLKTGEKLKDCYTGITPRSMAISDDGKYLYVVNYNSGTLSRVRAQDMAVLQSIKTNVHPIGVTYDPVNKRVWVACYTGSIKVYGFAKDTHKAIPTIFHPTVSNTTKTTKAATKLSTKTADTTSAPTPIRENLKGSIEPEKGKYYIIVGVFGNPDNATHLLERGKKEGFNPVALKYREGLTAISCDTYPTLEAAKAERKHAIDVFGGGWILHK